MSFREDLLARLAPVGVYNVKVDRDWFEKGRPAWKVEVFVRDIVHTFSFAQDAFHHKSGMRADDLAPIIKSYIKEQA